MKWLTNIYDPRRADAKSSMTLDDWEHQRIYLADKVLGVPKATKKYSADDLKLMGYVGVYEP